MLKTSEAVDYHSKQLEGTSDNKLKINYLNHWNNLWLLVGVYLASPTVVYINTVLRKEQKTHLSL